MVFTIITFIRRGKKNDARKKTEECKSFKFQEAPEESKKIILTSFKALNFYRSWEGQGRESQHYFTYFHKFLIFILTANPSSGTLAQEVPSF